MLRWPRWLLREELGSVFVGQLAARVNCFRRQWHHTAFVCFVWILPRLTNNQSELWRLDAQCNSGDACKCNVSANSVNGQCQCEGVWLETAFKIWSRLWKTYSMCILLYYIASLYSIIKKESCSCTMFLVIYVFLLVRYLGALLLLCRFYRRTTPTSLTSPEISPPEICFMR